MLDSLNKKTLTVMVYIYCRAHHSEREKDDSLLCNECRQVLTYGLERLRKCPYGPEKPNCPKCPIHCYSKEMSGKMKVIMRYSGPRMALRHPVLALYHLLNNNRHVSSLQ